MVKGLDGVMGGSRFNSQCGQKRKKIFTYKKGIYNSIGPRHIVVMPLENDNISDQK